MQVKCFACDAVVDAADAEAAEGAFAAHGRESHTWTYPEQAVRTYARNYAEATERLTGSTQRLDAIGEVTVHPVTEDRIDDWLQLFDHDGFADNPDWASCYCLEPHVPSPPDQPERPWRENRATTIERLRSGATVGYLAYVGERPAGWVNASLRSAYGQYGPIEPHGPAPQSVIGVSCFVIAPPFRRHGISSALLDRVIADASARGASWIEAYPHNAPRDCDAGHFRGKRSMYDARGFDAIEARERFTVVRRPAVMQTIYEAAGGHDGMLRLAHAWHARVLEDEVVNHAFGHGFHPQHTERLAAYWEEALGGPTTYTDTYGDETSVVRIHSGNGLHEEMDRRAIACFDQALEDVGLARDDRLRRALHEYFAWATTTTMARYHRSAEDVPDGLRIPRWSWNGLVAD